MDYNKYIWIPNGKKQYAIDADNVVVEEKDNGVAIYSKDENVFMFRFDRKTWTKDNASLYVIISNRDSKKALSILNGYEGEIETEKRKSFYQQLQNIDNKIDKLVSNKTFMINKSIKDKMKRLAELSNEKLLGHIDWASTNLPEIIKSTDETKSISEKGFKFFGNLQPQIIKSKDGDEEVSHYVITTKFTSNRLDLDYEITSGNAIKKAIQGLQNKVIPIRFEHGKEDFGVWHKFYIEEKNGNIYGIAEGELDMDLFSSRDLWKQLYEYGKQFATSYGGKVTKSHIEVSERPINVIDEIEFTEISLTTTPANPDTALEAITKHINQLIDSTELIVKTQSMDDEQKETTEVVEPTPTETSEEVKPEETTQEEKSTGEEANKEMPVEEPTEPEKEPTEEDKWREEVIAKLNEYSARISELENRLMKLEDMPAEQKSVVITETKKSVEETPQVNKSAGGLLYDQLISSMRKN